jgi:hypothetical protein
MAGPLVSNSTAASLRHAWRRRVGSISRSPPRVLATLLCGPHASGLSPPQIRARAFFPVKTGIARNWSRAFRHGWTSACSHRLAGPALSVVPLVAVRWVPGSGSTFPAPRQAQSGERRRRFPSRELRHEPPCRICRARAVTPWDPGYMGGKASLAPYQLVSLTPRGVGKPCVWAGLLTREAPRPLSTAVVADFPSTLVPGLWFWSGSFAASPGWCARPHLAEPMAGASEFPRRRQHFATVGTSPWPARLDLDAGKYIDPMGLLDALHRLVIVILSWGPRCGPRASHGDVAAMGIRLTTGRTEQGREESV